MKRIVAVWCNDRRYFLDEICLLETAKWHASLGVGPVEVLVLNGYDIASEFSSRLQDYGYTLHDASGVMAGLGRRYKRLKSAYPEFLFMNFMRWLAVDEYFQSAHCACFDADLVLSSAILDEPAVLDATFTSTSTCFVVINDRRWFDGYRELVTIFNDEPEAFSAIWNRDVDEYILRLADAFQINEETFVRFLVKTRRVPHAFPAGNHLIAPFLIELSDGLLPYTKLPLPVTYERRPGQGEYFNDQPLAYLHFQYHLKEYLALHLLYKKLFGGIAPLHLEPGFRLGSRACQRPDIIRLHQALREMAVQGKFGNEHSDIFTRRRVMQEFLFNHDLRDVFNCDAWHTPDVFV